MLKEGLPTSVRGEESLPTLVMKLRGEETKAHRKVMLIVIVIVCSAIVISAIVVPLIVIFVLKTVAEAAEAAQNGEQDSFISKKTNFWVTGS